MAWELTCCECTDWRTFLSLFFLVLFTQPDPFVMAIILTEALFSATLGYIGLLMELCSVHRAAGCVP